MLVNKKKLDLFLFLEFLTFLHTYLTFFTHNLHIFRAYFGFFLAPTTSEHLTITYKDFWQL